jgi:hypothetical protein
MAAIAPEEGVALKTVYVAFETMSGLLLRGMKRCAARTNARTDLPPESASGLTWLQPEPV